MKQLWEQNATFDENFWQHVLVVVNHAKILNKKQIQIPNDNADLTNKTKTNKSKQNTNIKKKPNKKNQKTKQTTNSSSTCSTASTLFVFVSVIYIYI